MSCACTLSVRMHLKYTYPPQYCLVPCYIFSRGCSILFHHQTLPNTPYITSRKYFSRTPKIVYSNPQFNTNTNIPFTFPLPLTTRVYYCCTVLYCTLLYLTPSHSYLLLPFSPGLPSPTSSYSPTPLLLPRLSKTSSPHFHLHRLLTSCLFCIY